MPPPPASDVRATGFSLALAALACGVQAEHRADETSTTPSEAMSLPAGEASAPTIGEAPLGDLEGEQAARYCQVRDLVAGSTPTADLAVFALRHDDFARRTLYSWTTADQVRELRDDPTLLTRAATVDGQPGRAAEVIQLHAAGDPLAALLAQPRFENKRFGWSNAWATLRGFGGESYGNHLLRVTLREQAWLGSLIVSLDGSLEWAFADVQGNAVAAADVLASPERLAAVYFVDQRGAGCGTLGSSGSAFREYFLCNEAMLESYALYSTEVRAEIDRSISALTGLRQALVEGRCSIIDNCWPDAALAEWGAAAGAEPALAAGYFAALAFPGQEYSPTPANVAELLRLLGQVPFEAPLVHTYPE